MRTGRSTPGPGIKRSSTLATSGPAALGRDFMLMRACDGDTKWLGGKPKAAICSSTCCAWGSKGISLSSRDCYTRLVGDGRRPAPAVISFPYSLAALPVFQEKAKIHAGCGSAYKRHAATVNQAHATVNVYQCEVRSRR